MPWMPAPSRKRQINWLNNLPRYGTKPTALVLHISAGNSASLYSFFSNIRYAGSHFHVARDGTIEQYAGTGARSAADRSSRRTISVETQGTWGPWTKDQIRGLAEIFAYVHIEHGIPLRLMTSSKTSQHGLGWHRLGVNGNFPPGRYGGRLQRGGGELWSGSTGKACPTPPCIDQLDDVLQLAKEIVNDRGRPASRGEDRDPAPRAWRPLGTLRQGSRGSGVLLVQRRLRLDDDGSFGPKTKAAVKKFQKARRLKADGVVGENTWIAMLRDGDDRLKRGDRNSAVPILQRIVGAKEDGVFGPGTEAEVKKAQAALGVTADGVFGPTSRTELAKKWK